MISEFQYFIEIINCQKSYDKHNLKAIYLLNSELIYNTELVLFFSNRQLMGKNLT